MSSLAEKTIFHLLLDIDSIDTLALEGFGSKYIPTPELRPVYLWALDYYQEGHRVAPPTIGVFKETLTPSGFSFYDLLQNYGIILDAALEEELPTVEWAMNQLQSQWITTRAAEFNQQMSVDVMSAVPGDRVQVISESAGKLVELSLETESKRNRIEFTDAIDDVVTGLDRLRENAGEVLGMQVGLKEVDELTFGLHPGELGILGGGPKSGKSFFLDRVALKEWERGRTVALYTLEISMDMVMKRIACMACGLNPMGLMDPNLFTAEEREALADFVADVKRSDVKMHIMKPNNQGATIERMVTEAKQLGADSLLIDQLTFVEHRDPRIPMYQQIKDSLHLLHDMISSGREPLPCLMAHQMNREGKEFAYRNGFYRMEHMSEGSEVERTADWAFAIFASEEHRHGNSFLLQTLASRRTPLLNWNVSWTPETGIMEVMNEARLDEI